LDLQQSVVLLLLHAVVLWLQEVEPHLVLQSQVPTHNLLLLAAFPVRSLPLVNIHVPAAAELLVDGVSALFDVRHADDGGALARVTLM